MLHPIRRGSLIAGVRRAWRRSLQVRVVTITLVTSGAMVATFGFLVSARITDALMNSKEQSAFRAADRDSESTFSLLQSRISDPTDPTAAATVVDLKNNSSDLTGAEVRMVGNRGASKMSGGLDSDAGVPAEFSDALRTGMVKQRLQLDIGHGEQLYLVIGRELGLSWGSVQVYYFFPLQDEQSLATEFARTISVTGLALVLMLALLAYLVTRLVVSPVRVAARTAQRLSNGLLDQRMAVNGEDDLAALAASFNQMAENLQRHILRLEEMSRLQRRFTSDVSHELRTPLTTVRMAADLIYDERAEFEAPVARSAELLVAELDRFEGLLAELLEISRFDAGFAALDAEPANLVPMVERVVDRLGSVAARAGCTLDLDLPTEPVVAEVDVRRVERILRNLVGNAIEHGEGKPVKIRLAAREGAVAITVRDHGVGLKPGEEKLVFNRFWRADPSRARQTGGTGLGLSISVEDARLHGGWLEAWGAPGQGAQFRLTVPTRAGDRLVASPLRLVPTDFRPPTEALPEPRPTARPGDVPDAPISIAITTGPPVGLPGVPPATGTAARVRRITLTRPAPGAPPGRVIRRTAPPMVTDDPPGDINE